MENWKLKMKKAWALCGWNLKSTIVKSKINRLLRHFVPPPLKRRLSQIVSSLEEMPDRAEESICPSWKEKCRGRCPARRPVEMATVDLPRIASHIAQFPFFVSFPKELPFFFSLLKRKKEAKKEKLTAYHYLKRQCITRLAVWLLSHACNFSIKSLELDFSNKNTQEG